MIKPGMMQRPAAAVDLKRQLLLRMTLFALAVGRAAAALVFQPARERIRLHVERTGATVGRLMTAEADHLRDGFRRSLEGVNLASLGTRASLAIVGEAGTAREAQARYCSLLPDVLVLDLGVPDMGGVELVRRLLQRDAAARILVFTMHRDPLFATQALRAGALGYVAKSPPEVLLKALYQVAGRRQMISPDIAPELALSLLDRPAEPFADLAPREFEILRLLLDGLEPEAIDACLFISAKTVQNTHYQIKSKLGVRSGIELTRLAMRRGLI